MNAIVMVYNKCKYYNDSEVIAEVKYNIKGYEVVNGGARAEEIERDTDTYGVDDFHEYLILNLADGETSTFRNHM